MAPKAVFSYRLKAQKRTVGPTISFSETVKGFMPLHVTSTPHENASVSINAKSKIKNAKVRMKPH
jgi:hypothetical protein